MLAQQHIVKDDEKALWAATLVVDVHAIALVINRQGRKVGIIVLPLLAVMPWSVADW